MPEALQSGHAPLLDAPQPPTPARSPARVHVLRRRLPELPQRPRWQDHLRDLLEPVLFAATVVLAVLALGLWASPPSRPGQGRDAQQDAPTAKSAPGAAQPRPAQAG